MDGYVLVVGKNWIEDPKVALQPWRELVAECGTER